MNWKFWKRKDIAIEKQIEELFISGEELARKGWKPMMHMQPTYGQLIELYRPEWDCCKVMPSNEIHPATNAYGLYWRYWNGLTIDQYKTVN